MTGEESHCIGRDEMLMSQMLLSGSLVLVIAISSRAGLGCASGCCVPGTGEAQAQGKEGGPPVSGGVGRRSETKLSMLLEYPQFHIQYIWGEEGVAGGGVGEEREREIQF